MAGGGEPAEGHGPGEAFAPVLLEDTWEADDVKAECEKRQVRCTELSVSELHDYDDRAFVASTFMCDTALVQTKLEAVGLMHKVPATYPEALTALLKRQVAQRRLADLAAEELPLFVKPVSNDKAFDGRVVSTAEALAAVRDEAAEADCAVWVAEPVRFLVEHRLFVGGGRLYGTGRIQGENDDTPPDDFVDSVLERCGREVFWAVDVGLLRRAGATGDTAVSRDSWAVVEVNPPFALDDHGLAIERYCQYCADACAWIRS